MIVKSLLLIRRRVCQEHANTCITRSFAVYAVGDGWTGALGQKYATSAIAGHHDDEEETDTPVLIYPDKVDQGAVGWDRRPFSKTASCTWWDDRTIL
jgi:hypothetical protein